MGPGIISCIRSPREAIKASLGGSSKKGELIIMEATKDVKIKNITLHSFDWTGQGDVQINEGAKTRSFAVPDKLRDVILSGHEGVMQRMWCATKNGVNDPICWIWFDGYNSDLGEAYMHIHATMPAAEQSDIVDAVCWMRSKALSCRNIQVICTATEDAELLRLLTGCGFEPSRMIGEAIVLEFHRHSSGRFYKYILASLVLAVPCFILFNSLFSAISVGLCIGLGGGYIYDEIQRQRFLKRRASIIYSAENAITQEHI